MCGAGLERRVWLALALVFVIGFGVRAVVWTSRVNRPMTEDSGYYERQARQIRSGGWEVYFPNGYPLLVAAIPGEIGTTSHRWVTGLVNCALGAWTACAVVLLVRSGGAGVRAAVGAGLVCALWPNQVSTSAAFMSEGLAGAALWGAAAALFAGRTGAAGGVLAGIAVVTRTSLLPAMVIWIAALARGSRGKAAAWLGGGVLAAWLAFGAVGAWKTGRFAVDGALGGNIAHALGTRGDRLQYGERSWYLAPTADMAREYVRIAQADPGEFLTRRAAALWALWGPWPGDGTYGRSGIARAMLGMRFPLILLGIWAVWRARREALAWVCVAPALAVTALHVLLYAQARYTAPAEPGLIALVAVSLATLGAAQSARQERVAT